MAPPLAETEEFFRSRPLGLEKETMLDGPPDIESESFRGERDSPRLKPTRVVESARGRSPGGGRAAGECLRARQAAAGLRERRRRPQESALGLRQVCEGHPTM